MTAKARFLLDLATDDEHRDRIGPGPKNSIQGIDTPGTGRHADHSHATGNPCVAFCRHGARLLMMLKNGPDACFLPHRIVEMHGSATCHHENIANPLLGKHMENIIRKFHRISPSEVPHPYIPALFAGVFFHFRASPGNEDTMGMAENRLLPIIKQAQSITNLKIDVYSVEDHIFFGIYSRTTEFFPGNLTENCHQFRSFAPILHIY